MLYKQFVSVPKEEEASKKLSFALSTFDKALNANTTAERDSLFTLSLNGNKENGGFLNVCKIIQEVKQLMWRIILLEWLIFS